MHLFRLAPTHFESFQNFSWVKPSNLPGYLPHVYRGVIAFAIMNVLLLLVVHYIINHRLQAFADQAGRQLQSVSVRI